MTHRDESGHLTDAQRRHLRAVADGYVSWYRPWSGRSAPSWTFTYGVSLNRGVLTRLADRRLIRVGKQRNPMFSDVELTDAGREALS